MQHWLVSLNIHLVNYSQPRGYTLTGQLCVRTCLSWFYLWIFCYSGHIVKDRCVIRIVLVSRKGEEERDHRAVKPSNLTEGAARWTRPLSASGGVKGGPRGSLETDVKQELVCLTSPLQQASWRRNLPLWGLASKLLPHTLLGSACDLLSASKQEEHKTRGAHTCSSMVKTFGNRHLS